jgi:hypothetical protein
MQFAALRLANPTSKGSYQLFIGFIVFRLILNGNMPEGLIQKKKKKKKKNNSA